MMKRTILSLSILGICTLLHAQVSEWENPEIFEINKEPARATALPYSDATQAIADIYSASPWFQ